MKRWQRFTWRMLLALAALWTLTGVAFAETIITDDDGVSEFELYQNGLYWWSAAGRCNGEFLHDATIRLRNTLSSNSNKNLLRDCNDLPRPVDNVVRDDSYLYFFHNGQLSRKALNATEQDAPQPLAQAPALPANANSANLALAEGKLYWSVFNSQSNNSTIFRMPADGSQAPTIVSTAQRRITKLAWRRYTDSNSQSQEALVWLTDDARLFRFRIGSAGVPQELTSGVADFAIHTHIVLFSSTTSIYAAIGSEAVSPSSTAGKVLQINLDNGNQSTIYNATGHDQVFAVTTDSTAGVNSPTRNIYIAVAGVGCGDVLCTIGNTAIYRHALPANVNNWQLIVASGVGSTLRSDNQWLYYVTGSGKQIDRIKTDAPALELDIKADGVEIVQVVQSLNQDVKLVANKPTFARGYAHLAKNTTGKTDWLPQATLRGFLNGTELPGSPLTALNSVNLDTTSDINVLRNSLTRSYLFRLPDSWVKNAGSLTVEFKVDPMGTLPETASTADNKIGLKAAATIVKKEDTCLDFVRMHTATTISANPTGLTAIVARAKTLLPVQEFQVRTANTRISKPVFHVDIECWGPFCVPVPYVTDEPFTMANDKSWAMALLTIWDTFHSDFGSCSDSHLVGMVHPSEGGFNGLGLTTFSNDLMVRMEPGAFPDNTMTNPVLAINTPYGGRTLAHELGHNYGREHVDQTASSLNCGGSTPAGPDSNYPYDTCTIGAANTYNGFDTQSQTLVLPTTAGDLMSYATTRWTSKYTWDAILAEVEASSAGVQASAVQVSNAPMLLVTGLVTPTQGTGRFDTFYLLPDGAAPQTELIKQLSAILQAAAVSADPYLIRQLDANGATLADTQLVIDTAHDDAGPAAPFAQYVPFNAQTKRVQLVQSSKVLAEKSASANAPSLTLQAPVLDPVNQTMALQWLAYDNDNTLTGGFTDVIFFTVQYSPDNGATWYTLLVQYPWLAATVETDLLPGGAQALIRVLASDGFNTTIATSAPFALAKHAPVPIIDGVIEGERIPYTKTITLLGLGLDAEDGGIPADKLSWTISGPTAASGTGTQLALTRLAPGSYTATLTATDKDNQTGAATRHFEVLPLVVADRTEPTLDGACADAGYTSAASVVIAMPSGQAPRGWLLHAGGKLYACFVDLQLAAANAPTMTLTLRFDVDNSGGNAVQAGDLGFGVDQEGVPYQLTAANGTLQVTLAPQLGYSAVVGRNANGWSAELALDEALLGGWNHGVRILFSHTGVDALLAAGATAANGLWPETGNRTQPATWAAAYLGTPAAPANQAPTANAGADLYENVAVTKTIGLDGSGSVDPDGNTLIYRWTQVAGPTVTLTGANSATPNFQVTPVATATTLRFQLVVNDGAANSPADEVVVNLLPTARPHTPKTFTPTDLKVSTNVYLPLIQR
ncbi:MAG: hypothetical protein DYG89_19235 [Caldilinea sp. CFX5]|nr:hypothetical protein [Caldilinea sp. CFX5]